MECINKPHLFLLNQEYGIISLNTLIISTLNKFTCDEDGNVPYISVIVWQRFTINHGFHAILLVVDKQPPGSGILGCYFYYKKTAESSDNLLNLIHKSRY